MTWKIFEGKFNSFIINQAIRAQRAPKSVAGGPIMEHGMASHLLVRFRIESFLHRSWLMRFGQMEKVYFLKSFVGAVSISHRFRQFSKYLSLIWIFFMKVVDLIRKVPYSSNFWSKPSSQLHCSQNIAAIFQNIEGIIQKNSLWMKGFIL